VPELTAATTFSPGLTSGNPLPVRGAKAIAHALARHLLACDNCSSLTLTLSAADLCPACDRHLGTHGRLPAPRPSLRRAMVFAASMTRAGGCSRSLVR
jgi:hypothetical protein